MEVGEIRRNAGYCITNAIRVNNMEYVLGFNRDAPSQYATWQCRWKDNYLWGHYMNSEVEAVKDLCGRVIEEIQYLEEIETKHYGISREQNESMFAMVEYKEGAAMIQFPTLQIGAVLGSIGLRLTSKEIYTGGNPDIKVRMIHDGGRVPEALIRLAGEKTSLYTLNEMAKAIYHTDWYVSGKVEENLSKDVYDSPEALLEDAEKYKEKVKAHEKKMKKTRIREER